MKSRIKQLIANHSYNDVERMLHSGTIGQATFEAYCRVWEWCAPRFGHVAWKHDSFWKRFGKEAYYAKINRVRIAFGFEPYAVC